MRPKKIKEQIRGFVEVADKMPPPIHIWGPPGVGKSAIVKQVTQELNIGFIDLRMSLLDPTDLRGIPTVSGNLAKWLQPTFLPTPHFCLDCQRVVHEPKDNKCPHCGKSNFTDKGILFLDELTSAPPLTQASGYQLTLDKKIAEYTLPPMWYVLGAGNRIEDRAVVYRMSSALANRFMHLNFDVNLDDWIEWSLQEGQIDPNIIAFMKFRGGDLLFAFNPESSEKAFPTPRTWEFVSKTIKYGNKSALAEALEGTIGQGATAEFVNFLKVQNDLPDLNKILNGGDNTVPKPLDLKYALTAALVTRAKGQKQFDRLIDYSEHMPEEFAVLMVSMLVSKDEGLITICPNFDRWARKHQDVVLSKRMVLN